MDASGRHLLGDGRPSGVANASRYCGIGRPPSSSVVPTPPRRVDASAPVCMPRWQSTLERELHQPGKETSAGAQDSSEEKPQSVVSGLWGVRYQVNDVSRSVAFYTQRLGFKLTKRICQRSPESQFGISN